eukprot:scaffold168563_cov28-Tisochrysis_lutea.AAC.2
MQSAFKHILNRVRPWIALQTLVATSVVGDKQCDLALGCKPRSLPWSARGLWRTATLGLARRSDVHHVAHRQTLSRSAKPPPPSPLVHTLFPTPPQVPQPTPPTSARWLHPR